MDLFKQINDTHGHLFGDHCLIEISKVLKRFFNREADIVARFGGEEFVVVSQCDDIDLLMERMNKLLEYIANYVFKDGSIGPVKLTISMGIAVGEASYSTQQEEWFSVADKCLYDAKHNGRNQTKLAMVSAIK